MEGWNPWRELRRREHIEFALGSLPAITGGAIYWPQDGWAAIVIDRNLSREERREALTHELIHDERGGGSNRADAPASWLPRVAIDEGQIDDEVARRLVPQAALTTFCQRRATLGLSTDAADAAGEFEVSDSVAARALRRLMK